MQKNRFSATMTSATSTLVRDGGYYRSSYINWSSNKTSNCCDNIKLQVGKAVGKVVLIRFDIRLGILSKEPSIEAPIPDTDSRYCDANFSNACYKSKSLTCCYSVGQKNENWFSLNISRTINERRKKQKQKS